MNRARAGLFEQHVEKAVLLLSFGVAVGAILNYLVRSPNRVAYGGRELSPGELSKAICEDAERMRQRLAAASADGVYGSGAGIPTDELSSGSALADAAVAGLAANLRVAQRAGILSPSPLDGTSVSPTLPLAASFGTPIEVPGLDPAMLRRVRVRIAPPVPPEMPVARVGRSRIAADGVGNHAAGSTDGKPTSQTANGQKRDGDPLAGGRPGERDVAWVTVAAWFDTAVQQQLFAKCDYPAWRRDVAVVSVDAQRQDVTDADRPSGWVDLKPGMGGNSDRADQAGLAAAGPRNVVAGADFPGVRLGPGMQDLLPRAALNSEALARLRDLLQDPTEQLERMQPAFPAVLGGDPWVLPALQGLNVEEPLPAEKRINAQLVAARRALRDGDAERVRLLIERVLGDPNATNANRRYAGRLATQAGSAAGVTYVKGLSPRSPISEVSEQPITRHSRPLPNPSAKPAPPSADSGPEGGSLSESAQAGSLVMHPERGIPAVWLHDDSTEPGRTYRYRLRVRLLNRYFARLQDVQDAAGVSEVALLGEWSEAGDPVRIPDSPAPR